MCDVCGLSFDRESTHSCPERIKPDDMQRMRGKTSARCDRGHWSPASVNSRGTVSWRCESCNQNYNRTTRYHDQPVVPSTTYAPPPLPPATPGSARWATED